MRKVYISTMMFFEHIKTHKSRLYMLGPISGISHTYSVCYSYNDDMYCIIVNDEAMMHFMVKKAQELMGNNPKPDVLIEKSETKKPRKKKALFNFWK